MEITIEITSFCIHKCEYCSTNATEKGKHLPFEVIKKFLKDAPRPPTRINISGGEPMAHPDIYKILSLCQEYTSDYRLYTNMIPRLSYNRDILDGVRVTANQVVSVPEGADELKLLKLVKQGRATRSSGVITLSGQNCSKCDHMLLQANGKTVNAPCEKVYP